MPAPQKKPKKPPDNSQSDNIQDDYFLYFGNRNSTFSFNKITPREAEYAINCAERGNFVAIAGIMALMLKDPDILSPFLRRVASVNSLSWSIQPTVLNPTEKDIYYAEQIENIFRVLMDVPTMLADLCNAMLYGFVALEIACKEDKTQPGWVYVMNEGHKIWYPRLVARPFDWFQTDLKNGHKLQLRDSSFSINGIELEPYNWVVHRHPLEANYYGTDGILIKLVSTYISKRYSELDWSELLEKLGIPLLIGRYRPGATLKDRATLKAVVTDIGHATAGILPENTKIEALTPVSADGTQFESKIQMEMLKIEKLILGNSILEAAKLGGIEGTKFINKSTHQRLLWDTHLIAKTIQRCIIGPIMGFSFGVWDQFKIPSFVFDTRVIGDFGAADGLYKLMLMGAEIPVDFVNEAFNIPKAAPDQKILRPITSPQSSPISSQLQQQFSQRGMAPLQEHNEDADDIEKIAKSNSEDEENLTWIKDLVDRINQSTDFEDIEQVFLDWLAEVDISKIQKNLAYSIYLKMLQGRIGDDHELELI